MAARRRPRGLGKTPHKRHATTSHVTPSAYQRIGLDSTDGDAELVPTG